MKSTQRVVFLLLAVLSCGIAQAGINDGLVEWLAPGADLGGVRQLEFHPVVEQSGTQFEFDAAAAATRTLQAQLSKAGMALHGPGDVTPRPIVLRTSIEYYQPGSVGGRWVGFGGGAAACILRARLFDGDSARLLADVAAAYQVQVGGLFTVGAEKKVPTAAAELLANRLLELVGLHRVDNENE